MLKDGSHPCTTLYFNPRHVTFLHTALHLFPPLLFSCPPLLFSTLLYSSYPSLLFLSLIFSCFLLLSLVVSCFLFYFNQPTSLLFTSLQFSSVCLTSYLFFTLPYFEDLKAFIHSLSLYHDLCKGKEESAH